MHPTNSRRHRSHLLLLVAAGTLAAFSPASAAELRRSVEASGSLASNGSIRLHAIVGQSAIGHSGAAGTNLDAGFLAGASSGCAVGSTFDSDLDGWEIDGDNVYFWNGTDGNPGGCVEVQDDATGAWSRAIAPAEFLGSWATFTAADSLIYEAIVIPSGSQVGNPPYVMRIEGPGGAAEWDPGTFPPNVWNRFAAPMDSTQWNVVSGTWSGILANVGTVLLAAEMVSGDETVRFDNVCLTSMPSPDLFDPCGRSDFEIGVPGWTGAGLTISSVTTDGDQGAYMRVIQQTAVHRLLAPDWYHGDWSALDGDGSIGFSFTFLGSTIEPGREIRLELSGPGGAAYVAASTDAYALPNHLWIPFSWPIEEAAWTVTSGTWAGLLANVTEVAIGADYAVGNDVYGLDNFARVASACVAPPDVAPVFHAPGYSLCGATHFRDGAALAINPADGLLYALVAGTSATGGGAYVTNGPDAGSQVQAYQVPTGLVFTDDGDGFVTENGSGVMYRFVGTDSTMIWASTFHTGDDDPAGMIVAPPGFEGPNVTAGDILVADHGSGGPDEIWAVSPDSANGERLLIPDPGNVDWFDLATDGTTVWASDAVDDDILWTLHPDGTTSTLALSQNVTNRQSLVYDAGEGVLYTLRTTNPLGLYRTDPVTGEVTLVADGFGGFGYCNLEIDAAARKLWVADDVRSRIWEICLPPVDPIAAPAIAAVPTVLALSLRPNPVTPGTRIALELPRAAAVRVDIVNLAGRRVRTFSPGSLPAGTTFLPWDGRDGGGRRVAAGVYFVRMEAGNEVRTSKAVVLR